MLIKLSPIFCGGNKNNFPPRFRSSFNKKVRQSKAYQTFKFWLWQNFAEIYETRLFERRIGDPSTPKASVWRTSWKKDSRISLRNPNT